MLTKRLRRSMPKVRTGCSNCKTRRIKCDEQRPRCRKCVSTGRNCPGYSISIRQPTAITIYNLPFKVPGSRADRELLHFYHCQASKSLSKFSDSTLWMDLMMQRMQHQPVVRNALIALSSLYKDFLQRGNPSLRASRQNILIITKAHKQLRIHLLSRDASPEVALICSLIFYILECLVGNSQQAIWHLDQGLTLLQRCYSEYPDVVSTPEFGHLMAVFSRLDIHASIFDNDRAPILNIAKAPEFSSTVPDYFIRLSDAEHSLTVMQNSLMHHLISSLEHREKAQEQIPLDIIHERQQLEIQFLRLECGIEKLFLGPPEEAQKPQQQQRVLLLHVQAMIFHAVLLENIFISSDKSNIAIEADFRFDLALSEIETLLSSCPESNSASSNRDFTLSTNIIAVLYYICMKTRSHRILKTALSLIQGCSVSARDGLWDASMAASVVQSLAPCNVSEGCGSEIVKLEDVGSGIVDTSGGLEEAFRLLRIMESSEPEVIQP